MARINPQTPAGSIARIRGTVYYSHIASFIEGDELNTRNAERQARGMNPYTKPYTTIGIDNAVIVADNPGQLSLFENDCQARFWQSKPTHRNQHSGNCFSVDNKGEYLPRVGVQDGKGGYNEVSLEGELAAGTPVTLVVRCFDTRYGNKGMSLDFVLVEDTEVHYFQAGTNAVINQLASRGIVFNSAPTPQPAVVGPLGDTTMPQAMPMTQAQPDLPFAAPQQAMPQQAVPQQAIPQQVVPQQPVMAPGTPTANVPPMPAPLNDAYNVIPEEPNPYGNNYPANPGITYNPDDIN